MRAGGRKGGEDFARCLAFWGGACGEEMGESCIFTVFFTKCVLISRDK